MNKTRFKLHSEGPEVSKIALGFWRLHEWNMNINQRIEFTEKAIELGVTTFDHADIYGSYGNESLFGEILKNQPSIRNKIELVSKCGICLTTKNRPSHAIQHYNTTAVHIRNSVENSLKQLNTDYLDLLLIHRPDPLMDAYEIADCFIKLIDEGKIRHAGVSNFTPAQFDLLQSKFPRMLITNQVECSLLNTTPIYDGTFDQAQECGASPMLWSPFAGGKLFHSDEEKALRVRHIAGNLSTKYGVSLDQIALAWLMMLPCKPQSIIGTGNIERLKSAVNAIEITLERQDWFALLQASSGYPVP